jgi:hypothetical protein
VSCWRDVKYTFFYMVRRMFSRLLQQCSRIQHVHCMSIWHLYSKLGLYCVFTLSAWEFF